MSRVDLVTVAAVVTAMVLSAAATLALILGAMTPLSGGEPAWLTAEPHASGDPANPEDPGTIPDPTPDGELVVDVEGGVLRPGVHRLPAGSRVADVVAAAGGWAEDADLAAAARTLNLAAPVTDGQQIYVPLVGESGPIPGEATSGLVNLNRASQSELEGLPGIGPVTAEKIIAARSERPFATLDELVTRDVLTARQLEQVADLVTVP